MREQGDSHVAIVHVGYKIKMRCGGELGTALHKTAIGDKCRVRVQLQVEYVRGRPVRSVVVEAAPRSLQGP